MGTFQMNGHKDFKSGACTDYDRKFTTVLGTPGVRRSLFLKLVQWRPKAGRRRGLPCVDYIYAARADRHPWMARTWLRALDSGCHVRWVLGRCQCQCGPSGPGQVGPGVGLCVLEIDSIIRRQAVCEAALPTERDRAHGPERRLRYHLGPLRPEWTGLGRARSWPQLPHWHPR